MSQLRIGIIVGTTRPGRKSLHVAAWVEDNARADGVEFEIVDIADFDLPLLDEAIPAGAHNYQNPHTKKWAARIAEFDGFIFVTGEYNHTIPAALTNALSYINAEWNNKAAGVVSYGAIGGARANANLRQVLGELQVADVRQTVMLSLFTDFDSSGALKPAELHLTELQTLVDQTVRWARALRPLRV